MSLSPLRPVISALLLRARRSRAGASFAYHLYRSLHLLLLRSPLFHIVSGHADMLVGPLAANPSAKYLIFITHHIRSESKQSAIRSWVKDLSLIGFAKRNSPGVAFLAAAASSYTLERLEKVRFQLSSKFGIEDVDISSPGAAEEAVLTLMRERIKSQAWMTHEFRAIQSLDPVHYAALSNVVHGRNQREGPGKEPPRGYVESPERLTSRPGGKIIFLDTMQQATGLLRETDQWSWKSRDKAWYRRQQVWTMDGERCGHRLQDLWQREMKPSKYRPA